MTVLPSCVPPQWLIIHGRAEGKLLAPEAAVAVFDFFERLFMPPEQQEQLDGCFFAAYSPVVIGAWLARSLVAWAVRLSRDMPEKCGAVSITRGAIAPQSGQGCGA